MSIVLINGPFGVGKSTAANLVVERLPSAMLFDPEMIGAILHRFVGPEAMNGDYQDLQLWRHLTVDFAHRLREDWKSHLIVPMSLWRYEYFSEITDGFRQHDPELLCFRLTCTPESLRDRILGRPDSEASHAWCLSHLESGLAAANDPRYGTKIDTDGITPEHVAAAIIRGINANMLEDA